MSGFETRFAPGADAEGIRSAFYGFVGAHGAGVDGDACLRTEVSDTGQQILVRLWSAEAMAAFLHGLPAAARAGRRRHHE
ncbi:hypothetical protein [uncultured Phenylobacterium sp.]|uniref:hypothetical protein n=1 Tax=uncultured Phenylobacterium sp. TaxID=349273 RepID=UPI0025D942A5|nr:hypothetical protein [uncultured Phenylobacterium sp.]